MIDFQLQGKPLLVTGGGSGIGRAVCLAGAVSGAPIGVIDLQTEGAEETAQMIRSAGGRAEVALCDVSVRSQVEHAIAHLETSLGTPQLLVASAGISKAAHAIEMSEDQWQTVIDVNLTGVFNTCQSAGKRMVAAGAGAIVIVSSISGMGGHGARVNYSATKFGVTGIARSLAIEWGRHGVRVNAIHPGSVDTPLLRRAMPADYIENIVIGRNPMARMSTAGEQASACMFLLSEAASYVNGASLVVDGGMTAGWFTADSGANVGANLG